MEKPQDKLEQISAFFGVSEIVYAWCYDENGTLLCSNCPDETILNAAFNLVNCKYRMLEHYQNSTSPFMAGLPFGLIWLTAISTDEEGYKKIYALGPVYTAKISNNQLQKGLIHCATKSPNLVSISELSKVIQNLPTLPSNLLNRYLLMLHYMITGERLQFSDITINNKLNPKEAEKWLKDKDRHKTWMAEQALLQAVRDGNLNYRQVLANAQSISNGIPVHSSSNALDPSKINAIVFISLCTRAAIEGGLSPEEAYSLGDYYIQSVEDCHDYAEFMIHNHDMYRDFIQRVHNKKHNPTFSAHIQSCCDYIEFHVEEKLRIKDLADRIGYSEYYLSKKFKQETGLTINQYIRNAKIEHAKLLLTTTDYDINTIAYILNFSSRGYFGEIFLQVTGTTPAAYRDENKKL